MLLGAQLYTIRQFTQSEQDFARSMEKVAAIGYKTVQISAIGPIPAKTVKKICDDNGLAIVLTHTNPDRILNETETVIEEHNIMDCPYIGIGMMPERYHFAGWLPYFMEDYRPAAQKIKAAGKLLMYHNHDFEFAKLGEARVMDQLLAGFAPDELGFTLDTFWVQHAGGDVCSWIDKLAGRLPCVHLKDLDVISENGKSETVMAPVMEGNMNFPAILQAFEKAGTSYILVEQDVCREDPFACLAKSYQNVSALGYR